MWRWGFSQSLVRTDMYYVQILYGGLILWHTFTLALERDKHRHIAACVSVSLPNCVPLCSQSHIFWTRLRYAEPHLTIMSVSLVQCVDRMHTVRHSRAPVSYFSARGVKQCVCWDNQICIWLLQIIIAALPCTAAVFWYKSSYFKRKIENNSSQYMKQTAVCFSKDMLYICFLHISHRIKSVIPNGRKKKTMHLVIVLDWSVR